jgi:hypothetical protein
MGDWDKFVRTGGWDAGARPPMVQEVEAADTVMPGGQRLARRMTNPHPGYPRRHSRVMADMRAFPWRPVHSQPHLLGDPRALLVRNIPAPSPSVVVADQARSHGHGSYQVGQGGAARRQAGVMAGICHGDGDRVEGAFHDDRRCAAGEQIARLVQAEQQAAFVVAAGLGTVQVLRDLRAGSGAGAAEEPRDVAALIIDRSMTRSRKWSMSVPRQEGRASPAAWIASSL